MISVNLGRGIKAQLSDVSRLLNVSEDAFIKKAIENYLEDRQDYLDAIKVLHKNEKFAVLKHNISMALTLTFLNPTFSFFYQNKLSYLKNYQQ